MVGYCTVFARVVGIPYTVYLYTVAYIIYNICVKLGRALPTGKTILCNWSEHNSKFFFYFHSIWLSFVSCCLCVCVCVYRGINHTVGLRENGRIVKSAREKNKTMNKKKSTRNRQIERRIQFLCMKFYIRFPNVCMCMCVYCATHSNLKNEGEQNVKKTQKNTWKIKEKTVHCFAHTRFQEEGVSLKYAYSN